MFPYVSIAAFLHKSGAAAVSPYREGASEDERTYLQVQTQNTSVFRF